MENNKDSIMVRKCCGVCRNFIDEDKCPLCAVYEESEFICVPFDADNGKYEVSCDRFELLEHLKSNK